MLEDSQFAVNVNRNSNTYCSKVVVILEITLALHAITLVGRLHVMFG